MKVNFYLKTLFVLSFIICATQISYAQKSVLVVGESRKTLNNNKDVYHKKNREIREKMIEEAIFDAIEKGANKRFKSIIEHVHYSNTVEKSFEEVYEDFLSSTCTEYDVEWRRTSSYKFARLEGKLWKCEVEGEVRNITSSSTVPITKTPDRDLNYYITRKSFNIVHINAGKDKGVVAGDKFVAYRHKKKKTINGYNFVPKPVGLISIINSENRFSEGRIIKGIYGVKESQQAIKTNVKSYRLGLEYQFGGSYEQVNTTEYGEKESSINSKTHALYFYYTSYVSRMGFKIGLEAFDVSKETTQNEITTDTSAYAFLPKFNLHYSIGLIPDFVYLVPNASIGYLFFENGKECLFDKCNKPWGAEVALEGDLSVHLRLGSFDFTGGLSYKYINDYPELSNYYPHVGVAYNFVRYGKRRVEDNFDE